MKVTVDIDTDDVVRQHLVDDYRLLNQEIKILKENKKNLAPHRLQDLKDNKKWRKAVKTLINYYYSSVEAEEILKGLDRV